MRHSTLLCTALAALGCDSILGLDDYNSAPEAATTVASSSSGAGGSVGSGGAEPVPYAEVVRSDEPAAYWRFGEDGQGGGDLVVKDEMNKITGAELTGAFVLGVPGLLETDNDTAVSLGDLAGLRIGDYFDFHNRSAFTIELWFEAAAIDGLRNLVQKITVDGDNEFQGWQLAITQGANTAVVQLARWLDNGAESAELGPLRELATTYVASTYDGERMCVYLDDLRPACMPSTYNVTAHNDSCIVGVYGAPSGFEGVIDELAIYTRALPPERIRLHYLAGKGR